MIQHLLNEILVGPAWRTARHRDILEPREVAFTCDDALPPHCPVRRKGADDDYRYANHDDPQALETFGAKRVWGVVFLLSSTVGVILASVGNHLENESVGSSSVTPPGSGLMTAGAALLLLAAAVALVWLVGVIDRRVARPLAQELGIALGPLPPVEALHRPDGSALTGEEQAVLRWQMAQRQSQARQNLGGPGPTSLVRSS